MEFYNLFDAIFPLLTWETHNEIIELFGTSFVEIIAGRDGNESGQTHISFHQSKFAELLDHQILYSTRDHADEKTFALYEALLLHEQDNPTYANSAAYLFEKLCHKVFAEAQRFRLVELDRGEQCCNPDGGQCDWDQHLEQRYFHAIPLLERLCVAQSKMFRSRFGIQSRARSSIIGTQFGAKTSLRSERPIARGLISMAFLRPWPKAINGSKLQIFLSARTKTIE